MRLRLVLVLAAALVAGPVASRACVGDGCLNIFATAAGGGALTTTWDFASRKVQTFEILCAAGTCLYSAIDPGFLNGFAPFPPGVHAVAPDTRISFETVAADAGVRFMLNGEALGPGESGLIGITPDLHNHPSWQLAVPEGEQGDFALSFKLTTDSPLHEDSQTFTILLTNLPPPTATVAPPSATPTPTATFVVAECRGDCDGNGAVSVSELVRGVGDALLLTRTCPAMDNDGSGWVSIGELVAAVRSALDGCFAAPTPTATLPATFDAIQTTIFSPRCAIPTCHDTSFHSGDLVLEEDRSYEQLVGVEPDIDTARAAGLLRVDPGNAENSFLLIKLQGPPPDQGGRMPLTGAPLSAAEFELIRTWIAAGALP